LTAVVRVRRNGVVEAEHHVSAAIVTPAGAVVGELGDARRHFFVRSASKPFQARAALDAGISLTDQALAVACASHGGFPVHLAYVRSILADVGLDESALQTPPAWPLAPAARDLAIRRGATAPTRVFHNCSGKHASMLAACRTAGWPTDTYLDADHPLQDRIRSIWENATGEATETIGVDGCGAPVFTVSTRGLAAAFARLGQQGPFRRIWSAMHRYPSLSSANGRIDSRVATSIDAAAKIGAEACIGVAIRNAHGVGVKSWDGSNRGLEGGIIGCLRALGPAVSSAAERLEPGPPVLGGGTVQGGIDPARMHHVG